MRTRVRHLASILACAALLLPASAWARAPKNRNRSAAAAPAEPPKEAVTAAPPAPVEVENITAIPSDVWMWEAALSLDVPTFNGADVGPRGSGGFFYSLGEISPKLRLEIGPRAAFSYNGGDIGLWTADLLACGRLSVVTSPRMSLYVELGFGVGYANYSTLGPGVKRDRSDFFFDMLFAPGFIYALTPEWNLFGEVGFWMNATNGLGLHAAVPTVGVQHEF
jgi:hypothetical protein